MATGDDIGPAFDRAYQALEQRIKLMLELPLTSFDARMRRESLARIHDSAGLDDSDG